MATINYNDYSAGGVDLRAEREKHGFSRREMARLSGVPLRTLENWEARDEIDSSPRLLRYQQLLEGLSILTEDGLESVRDGSFDADMVIRMWKTDRVKACSIVGDLPDTFRACSKRIPERAWDQLDVMSLAKLVDEFYRCFGEGKEAGRREGKTTRAFGPELIKEVQEYLDADKKVFLEWTDGDGRHVGRVFKTTSGVIKTTDGDLGLFREPEEVFVQVTI